MAVLVLLEHWEGKFKKNSWEAAFYGAKTAEMLGTEAYGVVLGDAEEDLSTAGQYGLKKVYHLPGEGFKAFDAQYFAAGIKKAAEACGAQHIIVSGTFNGKALAPALSVIWEAALLTNVTALPTAASPFTVTRGVFSSKGFNLCESKAEKNIAVFVPNTIAPEVVGENAAVEQLDPQVESKAHRVEVTEVDRVKGKIPLPEAERVISGGRGLKGPENWPMLEELAELLDAGTACSKPVSDMDWRPHSEHVGQTGIAIKPNLYVAIGISGAIQHLAGVSASNTIVVINKDEEAPFFKAADYGVVGDAFEVVPRLTEAIKKFKANN